MSLTATSTRASRAGLNILKYTSATCRRRLYVTEATSAALESDVVIVGGGPAGLALASALGSSSYLRKNISITLIEGGDLDKLKAWNPSPGTFSNRVVSLTNTSQAFLRGTNGLASRSSYIGAWSFVDEGRTCGVEEIQVWDGLSDARIEFAAAELGSQVEQSGMSRLTENFNLQRGLLQHLDTIPEVKLLQQTKVVSITNDSEDRGGWPVLHLDNNKTIRTRLLVGADGFNSPVRAFAKIPSFGWAYNTQAIVATMNHPPRGAFEGPNTTAYQRFLSTGPIAFLPLSSTTSSLVWSTKPPLAAALLACDSDVLASMINAAFRLPDVSLRVLHKLILERHESGKPVSPSEIREEIHWREQAHAIDQNSTYASALVKSQAGIPPEDSESVPPLVTEIQPKSAASFPLRFNHAETYIGEGLGARTVLVGDAAHTVHPLAGQGLNLGLADVECLAKCIEDSLLNGGDIGSYTALLPYTQERYLANHTLMSAFDKLHKLYSTDCQPIVWVRSVGLEVLNELDSVKAGIMMTAGAQASRRASSGSSGWTFAGNAVQTLLSTVHTAGLVQGAIGTTFGSALKTLFEKAR
ncbi:ubiquinone biosynthesis hydrox [Pholiota conissans]|uniref:Ubiquinone biosynthesis monooxygenase COQ6, mitochondrial n=1 Tax=Pholiota conissans TaxID=109636 RepID=A0A9P5Z6T5_9AGAR|nr:ubiquinone biosynthesis hydrox [Pholiota conissans]